ALGQTELALQVERRQHLPVQDDLADVRRVLRERVDDGVAKRVALPVPRPGFELVRRVLHETRQDVLARRRYGRIGERRNHHVDVRPPREFAVLRLIVGALHVVDAWRNRVRAAQVRTRTGQAREIGQRAEGEVHLARRSAELVPPHVVQELTGQIGFGDELQEREARIDAREDHVGRELVTVGEHDARGFAVPDGDVRDRRVRPDLYAGLARRAGDRVRDRAGAAPRKAPGSEGAVDLTH